jgi:hypothetical protein
MVAYSQARRPPPKLLLTAEIPLCLERLVAALAQQTAASGRLFRVALSMGALLHVQVPP